MLCYSRPTRRVKAIWLNLEPSSEVFRLAVRRTPIGENLPLPGSGIGPPAADEPSEAAPSHPGARATATTAANAPETGRFAPPEVADSGRDRLTWGVWRRSDAAAAKWVGLPGRS